MNIELGHNKPRYYALFLEQAVWVDGDTINAVIEHDGKPHSLNAKMSAPHTSGGFHLQHTGSAGDSSTLIKGIELRP